MDLSSPPVTPVYTIDGHFTAVRLANNNPDDQRRNGSGQAATSSAGEPGVIATDAHSTSMAPLLPLSPAIDNDSVGDESDYEVDSPSSSKVALLLQQADVLEKAWSDKKLEATRRAAAAMKLS